MNTTFTRNGSIINLLSVLAPRIYSFHDISHKVNVFLKKTKSIIHFHVVLLRVRCKYTPLCRSVVYANSIGFIVFTNKYSRRLHHRLLSHTIFEFCAVARYSWCRQHTQHNVYIYCFRLHTFSKNEIILMSSDFIPKIKQSQKKIKNQQLQPNERWNVQ